MSSTNLDTFNTCGFVFAIGAVDGVNDEPSDSECYKGVFPTTEDPSPELLTPVGYRIYKRSEELLKCYHLEITHIKFIDFIPLEFVINYKKYTVLVLSQKIIELLLKFEYPRVKQLDLTLEYYPSRFLSNHLFAILNNDDQLVFKKLFERLIEHCKPETLVMSTTGGTAPTIQMIELQTPLRAIAEKKLKEIQESGCRQHKEWYGMSHSNAETYLVRGQQIKKGSGHNGNYNFNFIQASVLFYQNLRHLDLSKSEIGGKISIKSLGLASLTSLERLELRGIPLQDKAIRYLVKKLIPHKTISYLGLSDCNLSTWSPLASLVRENTSLKKIDISQSQQTLFSIFEESYGLSMTRKKAPLVHNLELTALINSLSDNQGNLLMLDISGHLLTVADWIRLNEIVRPETSSIVDLGHIEIGVTLADQELQEQKLQEYGGKLTDFLKKRREAREVDITAL